MKFLAMHITMHIVTVGHFTKYLNGTSSLLNILIIFGIKKINHFDPYNWFLTIDTNICQRLKKTFTFTHLADAFIQSDLQLHSGYTFSLVHVFPGNRTHNLFAQQTKCSTTEPHRNRKDVELFYSELWFTGSLPECYQVFNQASLQYKKSHWLGAG